MREVIPLSEGYRVIEADPADNVFEGGLTEKGMELVQRLRQDLTGRGFVPQAELVGEVAQAGAREPVISALFGGIEAFFTAFPDASAVEDSEGEFEGWFIPPEELQNARRTGQG